jgi:uncharacterized iron-regulated protein
MLKLSLKTVCIGCLVVCTGAAVAALAARNVPAGAPVPAYCQAGGNWLTLGTATPQAATVQDIITDAARHDVVLLGEQHDVEDHHRWQLQMLTALHAQRPGMVIGFEMFPRRIQPVLDQWVAGNLSRQEFLQQSEWDTVWGFPPHLYMPLFEFARANNIAMRALNVEKTLTRLVAENGWDKVPEGAREGVSRPAPALPDYLDFLREIHQMHAGKSGAHGGRRAAGGEAAFNRFVESQLTWDRAMAEVLSQAVNPADNANPPLVVGIMGSGHIRYGHGVPHQLRDLGVTRVASLLPVSGAGECQYLAPGLATAVYVLPNKALSPGEPSRL